MDNRLPIPSPLPRHVACIMDGNGRWAKSRGMMRHKGHRAGADAVNRILDSCLEAGIPWLTLYAFSSENWCRPRVEVEALMHLLHEFLKMELKTLMSKDIRLHAIGDLSRLPEKTSILLQNTIDQTAGNTSLNLVLALSYGSRAEILRAVRKIAEESRNGKLDPSDITEELFCSHLYTSGMPDPDLLIRTSGENRISNFLLWQISYSEIHVTDTLWPDFTKEDFFEALRDYAGRQRRFGGV